jgi:hypothetical protein
MLIAIHPIYEATVREGYHVVENDGVEERGGEKFSKREVVQHGSQGDEIHVGMAGWTLRFGMRSDKFSVDYDGGKATVDLVRNFSSPEEIRKLAAALSKAADGIEQHQKEWGNR